MSLVRLIAVGQFQNFVHFQVLKSATVVFDGCIGQCAFVQRDELSPVAASDETEVSRWLVDPEMASVEGA